MRFQSSALFQFAEIRGLNVVYLPVTEEIGLGAAVVLTVLGMILHWQLPRQRMALEEHLKDGTLTEAQAKRRLRVLSVCAPVATIAGVALLLLVVLTYAE